MNVYRFSFSAKCPANGAVIDYAVEIRTGHMIPAESLIEWRTQQTTGFHEYLADDLAANFGGAQRITATHHGVEIETLRP